MSRRTEYLRIGEIVRSHGVHGDVKVIPLTDDPARFRGLCDAFLETRGAYAPVRLENARIQPDAVLLHIVGLDTPEDAEKHRGHFLCVDRAHAVSLPADAYFIADLIGCDTFDTNGVSYGKLTDVLEMPANDVYVIADGRLMVPALKRVLNEVDIDGGRIVFDAEALMEVGLFAD